MVTILSTLVSLLSFRVRSRASLELELIALRHQVTVLRRQHPGRLRLFSTDRLLWVWLYRVLPQVLHAMVLVKPITPQLVFPKFEGAPILKRAMMERRQWPHNPQPPTAPDPRE